MFFCIFNYAFGHNCRVVNEIKFKALSVNECWQGKRFKTPLYSKYERDLLFLLPKISAPPKPLKIVLEFGMSNILSDWDNPIKPFQDILQKKYGFNDKDVYEASVRKVIVKKGSEYIKFDLISI